VSKQAYSLHFAASLAQMEREVIIERTKAGLDAAKAPASSFKLLKKWVNTTVLAIAAFKSLTTGNNGSQCSDI
jgi:DNA invertase Pin-like site-specific DNA recombinase